MNYQHTSYKEPVPLTYELSYKKNQADSVRMRIRLSLDALWASFTMMKTE